MSDASVVPTGDAPADDKLLRDAQNVLTWDVKDLALTSDPLLVGHAVRFAKEIVRLITAARADREDAERWRLYFTPRDSGRFGLPAHDAEWRLREALAKAMQHAWDDFVSDTGCYPECIQRESRGRLSADFERSNFALFVAGWLRAELTPAAARRSQGGADSLDTDVAATRTLRRALRHAAHLADDYRAGMERHAAEQIVRDLSAALTGTVATSSAPPEKCPFCGNRTMHALRFEDRTRIRTYTCLHRGCESYRKLIDEDDGDHRGGEGE